MRRSAITPQRVASYYNDMAESHGVWGGEARAWHLGVWEDDVRSHQQSLYRSNELLLRGLTVTPETQILDAGCGGGGFAIWAAKRFGCQVTGITIARANIVDARKAALAAGVADRCRFLEMDMDDIDFPAESLDVVTNQESHCYAQNKSRYLKSVFRVLRPAGVWSSIDFNRREGRLSRSEQEQYDRVLEAWRFPSLARPSEVLASAKRAGFVECEARDLTQFVLPSAAHVMRGSYLPLRLMRAFPKKRIHSKNAIAESNFRGYCEGGMQFSIGLHTGVFHAVLFRAVKPG